MKIYDISLTISPTLVTWPGDPSIMLDRVSKIEEGADANVSRIQMGVHTGTHVDAPFHFVAGGRTVESLPLEVLVGPAQVVQIPLGETVIDVAVLERAGIEPGMERTLFKTANAEHWQREPERFKTDFVAISVDGADWLVQHGVRLVGIDYLSVAPFDAAVPTHVALLKAGVIALEGLDLSQVQPGVYDLYCLPLKLQGSDGAPARTILIKRE